MAAADLLLGLLRGRWAIIRQITPGGRFEGTATFVPGAGVQHRPLIKRQASGLVIGQA